MYHTEQISKDIQHCFEYYMSPKGKKNYIFCKLVESKRFHDIFNTVCHLNGFEKQKFMHRYKADIIYILRMNMLTRVTVEAPTNHILQLSTDSLNFETLPYIKEVNEEDPF